MRLALISALLTITIHLSSVAASPLKVVATLSTFADLAETVGGEYVSVSYIAPPKFNPHFIQPKPSDVLRVKRADLFVNAGLDLELWRGPLLDAAGSTHLRRGTAGDVDMSAGIRLLEVPDRILTRAEGDIHLYGNPHYWMNPENAKILTATIVEKMSAADPAHAADFEKNRTAFIERLDAKISQWKELLKPFEGAELVGYHKEWPYLMEFAGLKMKMFLEPKPGVPPTPRHLKSLINYIKENDVRGIVQSVYFPAKASKSLSKRTGAPVIDLNQNVGESKEAGDYITMMDINMNTLRKALEG